MPAQADAIQTSYAKQQHGESGCRTTGGDHLLFYLRQSAVHMHLKETAMTTWALILAAGQGSRLAATGCATKKQFLEHQGRPLFWRCALVFAHSPAIEGLVLVFPEDELPPAQEQAIDLDATDGLGKPWLAVAGGARRQDSVRLGLEVLPPHCSRVLVHDAARPFFTVDMIDAVLAALRQGAPGAVPGLPVTDTIKRANGDDILETLDRGELRAVQTPQGFDRTVLQRAHARALAEDWSVTDDASMVERIAADEGLPPVRLVPGDERNVKITTPKDLQLLQGENTPAAHLPAEPAPQWEPCTGWGYDVHRYGKGDEPNARPLKIGGAPIPGGPCVLAHSDGDVLLHALADALLGLMAAGDIGGRFPDTDPAFEGLESGIFISEIQLDLDHADIRLTHVDMTIIAQTPKLAPHREQIRKNVARLLRLDPSRVNVKATTEEKLGFTGRKEGIKAVAAVTGLRSTT